MIVNKWWKLAIAVLIGCTNSVTRGSDIVSLPSVTANVTQTEFRQPIDLTSYGEKKSVRQTDDEADLLYSEVGSGCCKTFLIGGSEATFLWPDFHRSTNNFTDVVGLGIPQNLTYASDVGKIDHNMLVGPRVWLGVQGCRWGIVGRYFNLADTSSTLDPALPSFNSDQVIASDRFRAYYADLEGVTSFCLGKWSTNASFGVRYASVDIGNTLSSSLYSTLGEYVSATSSSQSGFNGTGITMGMWGSRPIRPCSPWNWFLSGRASILWGNNSAYAQTQATTIELLGAASSTNAAYAKGTGDLFIGELQYGVQWERQLKCIPSRAFFRFAGEYQYWDASNSAYAAAGSLALSPLTAALAGAESGSVLFDLVGFTIGAGLTY